jgi:hypothetical protein
MDERRAIDLGSLFLAAYRSRGADSAEGKMTTRVDIAEPAMLIRINRMYRPGLTAEALYEATRGEWRVASPRCDRAEYAISVAPGGVVCAVYQIAEWHPSASTPYETRDTATFSKSGRREFTGVAAPREIQHKYVGRSVVHYFDRGSRNPIRYVNC